MARGVEAGGSDPRCDGALALELDCVSLVGNVFASLQACTHVVLEQPVFSAELPEAVATVANYPKRRRGAVCERTSVLFRFLLWDCAGRGQLWRSNRCCQSLAHDDYCESVTARHAKRCERLVVGRELGSIVDELEVCGQLGGQRTSDHGGVPQVCHCGVFGNGDRE